MRLIPALALIASLSIGGCASLSPDHARTPARFDFVVINDTPYNAEDEAMLAKAVPVIKGFNVPFILHVGDSQSGAEMCGPPDDRLATLMDNLAPTPVVYTPGDNEWSDCDRKTDPATGKKFSELQRLDILRSRFFSRPALLDPAFGFEQQPGMPENARFVHGELLFVTLNLSGTNNGRDFVMGDDLKTASRDADVRDAANVGWLKAAFKEARRQKVQAVVIATQADMSNLKPEAFNKSCTDAIIDDTRLCDGFASVRKALIAAVTAYKKPVFIIHGDTAPFTLGRGFDGRGLKNVWQLNAAGDAGIDKDTQKPYGVHDVTHVWIDLSLPEPIRAQGIVTGLKPDPQ